MSKDDKPRKPRAGGSAKPARSPRGRPPESANRRSASAPKRRRPRPDDDAAPAPQLRKNSLRVNREAAAALRGGHPWVFRSGLGERRSLKWETGEIITVCDWDGRFLGYGYYEAHGAVAVKLLSLDEARKPGPALYRAKTEDALALRRRLRPAGGETDTYRLINGEGDGFPGLTVDRYGDYLLGYLYSEAVGSIAEVVYQTLMERADPKPKALYEQKRYRPQAGQKRGAASKIHGKAAPVDYEVEEFGLRFKCDVSSPSHPGLFPDLRAARRLVGELSRGRSVLNTFSFTGAFHVHAARGGASSIVAVDLAQKAHQIARQNLALNGLDETASEYIAGDVFATLERFAQRDRRFDLIILDPPAFSRSKSGKVFSAAQDYAALTTAALRVLSPDGLILAVSNMARLREEELARAIGRGAGDANRPLRVLQRFGLPEDFPAPPAFGEGHYLKVILLTG